MVTTATDTIAAIATPPGHGGVGIVRLSGTDTPVIAQQLLGRLPRQRRAEVHRFREDDGTLIDEGLVLYFEAPASFTGEHVLELHGHGGPVVMDCLLRRVLSLGARPARPGEFSERAFLNNKLDLAQAEAIADLIESATTAAARAAARSLQGEFSSRVHALVERLTRLRMYVEAALDFPEEEIDFLSDDTITQLLAALHAEFYDMRARTRQGRLLRDGMTLVIAGRPNAGKSSLLNALSGRDAAIVTEIPGTTRDVLREHIQIDGLPLHIIDTAGLHASEDPVELAGMQRARSALEQADRVLLVIDDPSGFTAADAAILDALPQGVPHTQIFNKIDLSGRSAAISEDNGQSTVALSLHSGAGLELLRQHLKQCVGYSDQVGGSFSARRRHVDALRRAYEHVEAGQRQLQQQRAGELLAEELRQAQRVLGEITGEVSSDDLLGRIFSSFCIGK
ncbi:MAG: tRNA uridine-5-carboxymethylaminomethyl(34) synthesis GTPase MnmE [Gammaproteobacteria bacterium]